MSGPNGLRSPEQARLYLGLPNQLDLPRDDALIADAKLVVDTNLSLARELANLSAQGLQLSPLWEERGGVAHVRLAVRPPAFRTRYFEDPAVDAWADAETFRVAAEVLPWFTDDPAGGAFALEDTVRTWHDPDAPSR